MLCCLGSHMFRSYAVIEVHWQAVHTLIAQSPLRKPLFCNVLRIRILSMLQAPSCPILNHLPHLRADPVPWLCIIGECQTQKIKAVQGPPAAALSSAAPPNMSMR
eukprot:1992290-Amphidinium_carterae.1